MEFRDLALQMALYLFFAANMAVGQYNTSITRDASKAISAWKKLNENCFVVFHKKPSSMVVKRLLEGYERVTPAGATVVELGVYINSFDNINEQAMDYQVNIYLRQQWHDRRLKFDYSGDPLSPDMIKLEDGMWNKIWVPDVFFRNEKRADFHSVTVPQRLLRLYSDGRLWYVSKITAKLSCPMKLKKYPLDTQKCPFIFESFGHTLERVVYKWLPNSVEKEPFEMPQYQLIGWTQRDCSQNYTAGAFPCLQIDFLLKRDIGFYMIQVYIPSILIVILSWVSFWIDIDAVPARVPLGLLTVLTMTTQSAGANSHLPRVSYIKAIDVWMCMCLLFVFASLLEFALVNVYSRKEFNIWRRTNSMMPVQNGRKHHHHHHHRHGSDGAEEEIPLKKVVTTPSGISLHMNGKSDYASLREDEKRFLIEHKQKARHIDKISRKIFPVSFILFNVVYWVTYFMLPDD